MTLLSKGEMTISTNRSHRVYKAAEAANNVTPQLHLKRDITTIGLGLSVQAKIKESTSKKSPAAPPENDSPDKTTAGAGGEGVTATDANAVQRNRRVPAAGRPQANNTIR